MWGTYTTNKNILPRNLIIMTLLLPVCLYVYRVQKYKAFFPIFDYHFVLKVVWTLGNGPLGSKSKPKVSKTVIKMKIET